MAYKIRYDLNISLLVEGSIAMEKYKIRTYTFIELTHALLLFLRIPNVTVSMDEGEVELEISDDPFDCSRLDIKNIPLIVTLNKVGKLESL
jgi:hypothetical protein